MNVFFSKAFYNSLALLKSKYISCWFIIQSIQISYFEMIITIFLVFSLGFKVEDEAYFVERYSNMEVSFEDVLYMVTRSPKVGSRFFVDFCLRFQISNRSNRMGFFCIG